MACNQSLENQMAMLDELTIEANEESFVIVLQHDSSGVTCKRSIYNVSDDGTVLLFF